MFLAAGVCTVLLFLILLQLGRVCSILIRIESDQLRTQRILLDSNLYIYNNPSIGDYNDNRG